MDDTKKIIFIESDSMLSDRAKANIANAFIELEREQDVKCVLLDSGLHVAPNLNQVCELLQSINLRLLSIQQQLPKIESHWDRLHRYQDEIGLLNEFIDKLNNQIDKLNEQAEQPSPSHCEGEGKVTATMYFDPEPKAKRHLIVTCPDCGFDNEMWQEIVICRGCKRCL